MRIAAVLLSVSLFAATATAAPPETIRHRLIYGLEAAACLASVADIVTTEQAVSLGAREGNILFARPGGVGKGSVRWGRLIAAKSVLCGAPFAISFVAHHVARDRNADTIALGISGVATATYSWASYHNALVASEQREINSRK